MSEHPRAPFFKLIAMCIAGFAGCAPPAHMRPMMPLLPEHRGELGAGWASVGPRPVGQDTWGHGSQAWGTLQPTTWFDMSVVGVFADGITAGLALRWRAYESDRFTAGLGAELGIGWLGLNLPVAVKVQERLWIYSAPTFGNWGIDLESIRVPVGVDVQLVDQLHLRGEAQLNYPDFDPYKRRLHMGLGLAYRL